jgi:hypothetical protein
LTPAIATVSSPSSAVAEPAPATAARVAGIMMAATACGFAASAGTATGGWKIWPDGSGVTWLAASLEGVSFAGGSWADPLDWSAARASKEHDPVAHETVADDAVADDSVDESAADGAVIDGVGGAGVPLADSLFAAAPPAAA